MKGLKKTKLGAIALVIALVLALGVALTGCDLNPGSGSGFDPVGTWRAFLDGEVWTFTFWPGGTARFVEDGGVFDFTYSVADNYIVLKSLCGLFASVLEILDNNRIRFLMGELIIFTRM